jgi:hypothetical protein
MAMLNNQMVYIYNIKMVVNSCKLIVDHENWNDTTVGITSAVFIME